MQDTVIRIENLKKQYRLGTIGGGTLSADLQTWWAQKRGKEDPNSKIGAKNPTQGEYLALDGINLEVKRGEALGIIGSNGAGKSTLLKILSRVTAPTEGKVYINGRISSMLEVGTGFHQELTGRENIYLNGAILGMTKEEVDSKIEQIIAFSECGQFIDTPVKRYSSGMYVKLAFAVAANLDSEILVMDEVLAVGDMKFQEKCLNRMGDAAGTEGRTVLYVSHNMNTIRQLCTRCIVLNKGQIIFDGDVEQAIEVYMERDKGELCSFYSFEDTERPSLDHGRKLFIHSFEFVGKENAFFKRGEKLRFAIDYSATDDIQDLRTFFAIKYADSTVVGMTESDKPFASIQKGERRRDVLEVDISNLVEGTYYFMIDIFSSNIFGAHTSYDHPMQNIHFQIVGDDENKIIWERKYWGSVRLNPVIKVQK